MAEDFDNHRRIFDRGNDLQSAKTQKVIELVIVCLSLKFAGRAKTSQKTHHRGHKNTEEKTERKTIFEKIGTSLSPL